MVECGWAGLKQRRVNRGVPTRSTVGSTIFMSNGISYARTQDGWIDIHCAPVRARLAAEGYAVTMIVPGGRPHTPLPPPARFLEPRLDAACALALITPAPRCSLPGYDDAQAILAAHGHAELLPGRGLIRAIRRHAQRLLPVFRRVLTDAEARAAFLVQYYSFHGMAFVLACNRLGIPVADLQHGVQGELHFAYGPWVLPTGGYELLPTHFWVWSEREAEVIDRWAHSDDGRAAVVGGNPFLQSVGENLYARVRGGGERGRRGASGRATCRPAWEERSRRAQRWRARRRSARNGDAHPSSAGRLALVDPASSGAERGSTVGGDRSPGAPRQRGIEVADSASLPVLLTHMDATVSEFSSVALDSVAFGVPSVVLHPYGVELFARRSNPGPSHRASGWTSRRWWS